MELRVSRKELLMELTPMLGIVERKTTLPILSQVVLSASGAKIHLAATDLDVSLTSWCEAEVVRAGGIAIQAKKLVEIIRSIEGEEILLALEGPRLLSVRAGTSRFKIHGLVAEDFPSLPETPGRVAEIDFESFRRVVAKVFFAVSAEESRYQLNGALLKLKNGSLEMVATDGHRMALIEISVDGTKEDNPVLIPRKALQEIQRFEGKGNLVYGRGENHLSFALGRRELICRILEGTFPDYDRVILKENPERPIFDRRALSAAVQRASLMTGDRARSVRLQVDSERAVITAVNSDLGEAVEEVACEYDGAGMRLGLNPEYLRQALEASDLPSVCLELKDENTQCIVVPQGGPDVRDLCVIMPMRV